MKEKPLQIYTTQLLNYIIIIKIIVFLDNNEIINSFLCI